MPRRATRNDRLTWLDPGPLTEVTVFSLYNLLKYLHVLAVVVWFGGVIMFVTLQARLAASRDPVAMRAFSAQGKFLGMAVFGPSAAITLITGIAMVKVG